MKTRHWLLAALLTLLLAGGLFAVMLVLGQRFAPQPQPQAPEPEEQWQAYETDRGRGRPTKADSHNAMQLNVVPGVTNTREKLNDIERQRDDIRQSAGEDGPERY